MDSKKISFGFSKTKTKTSLIRKPLVEPVHKVEYISSFNKDEKRDEEQKEAELVIPSLANYTVAERILSKRKTDDEALSQNQENCNSSQDIRTTNIAMAVTETTSDTKPSIEQQAIQELLEESKKRIESNADTLAILVTEKIDQIQPAEDKVDYDCVPVSQFGYAMLRGMGWAPGKGVGKKQKIVEVQIPQLRPRGMGLGADINKLESKSGTSAS